MPTIFRLEYQTFSNEIEFVDYQLYSNEIVEAWLSTLDVNQKNLNEGIYGLHQVNVTKVKDILTSAYNGLKNQLLEKDRNVVIEDLYQNNILNQDVLNQLHSIFHYYQDRTKEFQFGPRELSYLQDLNREVHTLEAIPSSNSFMMAINPCRNSEGVEINPTWYKKYFNKMFNHGDLILGYATTGKELFEIYNTKDVANLNNISPQKRVYPEFRLVFSENTKSNGPTIDSLKEWAVKNGKDNFIDAELYTFRPKLGKIITDLSFFELRNKLLNYKQFYDWKLL